MLHHHLEKEEEVCSVFRELFKVLKNQKQNELFQHSYSLQLTEFLQGSMIYHTNKNNGNSHLTLLIMSRVHSNTASNIFGTCSVTFLWRLNKERNSQDQPINQLNTKLWQLVLGHSHFPQFSPFTCFDLEFLVALMIFSWNLMGHCVCLL